MIPILLPLSFRWTVLLSRHTESEFAPHFHKKFNLNGLSNWFLNFLKDSLIFGTTLEEASNTKYIRDSWNLKKCWHSFPNILRQAGKV